MYKMHLVNCTSLIFQGRSLVILGEIKLSSHGAVFIKI